MPFNGEVMECVMCDRVEKSDPHQESDWRAVQVEDKYYYICPDHFPDDNPTSAGYKRAYTKVFMKIAQIRTRRMFP